ncbi:carbamate kinase [Enterococcus entomosocium]|uniref:carbamate kinase n=1 Tax=Enterococcus entomosocium TaxID=3034352 RepID=UPI003BC428B1
MAKRVVIALGGNAILKPNQPATVETQLANIQLSAEQIAKIEKLDHQIVVTHGNGPQVGNILRQNEEAKEVVPPFPLDVCNAESQGFIGYLMEQSIKNKIEQEALTSNVVTLLTQVEVAADDPAFEKPTKPIGLFYSEEEAKTMAEEKHWVMEEDAGRGYRRVVPSPQPVTIHGVESMVHLLNQNTIVIAGGGGGIPVVKQAEGLKGIEAVIDKDRTGKKLAEQVDADVFMMLTDVSNVYINYGTPEQEKLTGLSVSEAQAYFDAGHFAEGSMGPKIEAAIAFAKQGKTAIICSLEEADLALLGEAGTRIAG